MDEHTLTQESLLMRNIGMRYGVLIAAACKMTDIRESFVAALVANESGGDSMAKRFEHGVLNSLWDVLMGRKANYGSIGAVNLYAYLTPEDGGSADETMQDSLRKLDGLATSWGLTQIMGYEILDQQLTGQMGLHPNIMQSPQVSVRYTVSMLSQISRAKGLKLFANFSELFDCWNTGRPHAPTADPNYIPNGLARMDIYDSMRAIETARAQPSHEVGTEQ